MEFIEASFLQFKHELGKVVITFAMALKKKIIDRNLYVKSTLLVYIATGNITKGII